MAEQLSDETRADQPAMKAHQEAWNQHWHVAPESRGVGAKLNQQAMQVQVRAAIGH